jgi:hypothetical protein
MSASRFDGVEPAPPIEVFALTSAFLSDPSPLKVNLGVGGKVNRKYKVRFFTFLVSTWVQTGTGTYLYTNTLLHVQHCKQLTGLRRASHGFFQLFGKWRRCWQRI